MRVELPYGISDLTVDVPDWARVVAGRQVSPLPDPRAEVERFLANPSGTPPLRDLSRGRRTACIVVSDNTRPVPNDVLLPPIIRSIRESVEKIRVLVATGLHPPLDGVELTSLLGGCDVSSCKVLCHNALDAGQLVSLGETSRGIPISVNRTFFESDLRILTGLVEPHFMAGYSGGRKSVCPGIAGARTIQWFHSPGLLESANADSCLLEGNPVHEESLEIARKVGVDFTVNVAIDDRRRPTKVTAGDLEEAWLECVRFVSSCVEVLVPAKADIVITTNGGYPQDRNYYQAIKGLVAAARVVRKNGVILLVAECRDGLGSEAFRANLERLRDLGDPAAYIDHILEERNFTLDQWEVEKLVHVLRRTRNILMYSEKLSREDQELGFTEPVDSVASGISRAVSMVGSDARILIMPQGPYVIPTVRRR